MELNYLKKEYKKLAEKYKIPKFEDLNRDFEIDKFDKNTDFLLRAVRKMMMEKIVNSINFLEMLLNPVNIPRMYLPYIKTMNVDDKKIIDEMYGILAQLTLMSLDLEIENSEKGEAELIGRVFKEWQGLKPNFKRIVGNIKKPKEFVNKREAGYFG